MGVILLNMKRKQKIAIFVAKIALICVGVWSEVKKEEAIEKREGRKLIGYALLEGFAKDVYKEVEKYEKRSNMEGNIILLKRIPYGIGMISPSKHEV